ncbi:MAG: helix-turn-helix transcriptional regulator [Actinobacteria bacterium]|nr:MAG: helix-turn-helix transcriptional regulator [Actinomycetota bacterium]
MRWSEIDQLDCSVAQALSVVGDRWTLLILRDAFMRVRRFEDFQERTGAPRPLLADRLKTLVDEGVLEKRLYSERPDRFEYRLTEKGLDLWPVLVSLLRWGDKWATGSAGPPVEVRHKACGHVVHPELACPDCGGWLTATDMEASYRREPAPVS